MEQNNDKPLVLMVDDDPDFQTIVQGWISNNYEHVGLLNGDGLIDEIGAVEPDLIILDVRMPGFNGFRLCNHIRRDRRFAHIPILFLTGCRKDEDFINNLNVGGTAYLTKPVSRRRLLSVIDELVPA